MCVKIINDVTDELMSFVLKSACAKFKCRLLYAIELGKLLELYQIWLAADVAVKEPQCSYLSEFAAVVSTIMAYRCRAISELANLPGSVRGEGGGRRSSVPGSIWVHRSYMHFSCVI